MEILKLKPSFKDYVWGGKNLVKNFHKDYDGEILAESWELSCHADGPSYILNGGYRGGKLSEYIEEKGREVLGTNCRNFKEFPILIKFIDARENLSIQVHPSDGYAWKHEGEYGKTEMWYVVDCKPGAFLYYGFSRIISKEELQEKIQNHTLLEVLNKVEVQKGDVLFIEAGTIHGIGKDIIVAEIQQNSNVTYRVYDYGRVDQEGKERDLHIGKALAVTSRVPLVKNPSAVPHLADCEYFTVDKLHLDGETMKEMKGNVTKKTFVSILVLEGNGILYGDEELYFQKGDSFFIPAGEGEYCIKGNCEVLITTIGDADETIKFNK